MLACLTTDAAGSLPLFLVAAGDFPAWRDGRSPREQAWLGASGLEAKPGRHALLPGEDGAPAAALCLVGQEGDPFEVAALPFALPSGSYRIEAGAALALDRAVLGWALGAYRFARYKKPDRAAARLVLPGGEACAGAVTTAGSVWLARDLVNTPANDLGPEELAGAFESLAGEAGASLEVTTGDALLRAGFPVIHAVGRASARAPRLIDLAWGDPGAPRVTLVGKGVCFDTGGLDIKPSSNMLLMKKDMGGAAVVAGLARAITRLGLPVRLRVLVPAVENSIAGAAFRPGDILTTRKGLTVEVGNTDAEGRLILADVLALADAESPDLLVDLATLTGAARVALGPDLPALFTPDDALADDLQAVGREVFDPLWRLPLHAPYRKLLESPIADLNNVGSSPFAGAVTAALFLQSFVTGTRAWAHLDIYGHNPTDRPGRPKGGEASALRALLALIQRRFGDRA
jgi:leucyl aminopeptidase